MNRCRQRGVTLIEVLVALAILGIAVLGHTRLQMVGIRSNTDAGARTQVSTELNKLADAIRLNRSAAAGAYAGVDYNAINCAAGSEPATACRDRDGTSATNCAAADLVTEDAWIYMCALTAAVPSATTALTWDGDAYLMTTGWTTLQLDGTESAESFSLQINP